MRKAYLLYIFFFVMIACLVINTGVFSDDFDAMASSKAAGLKNILMPIGNSYYIDTPVMYYSHYLLYYFFSLGNASAVNSVKIIYIILAFYLIAQFFKIYMDESLAILTSFLFVFFPSHDSTVFMFMNQYLILSFALYLYAYYLAYRNKLLFAFLSALAASFISYGSTPIAISLFVLFCLSKDFKKAAVMAVPNVMYASYFIYLTVIRGVGHPRTLEALSILIIIKQYALQILTFIDAVLGPSMWLKIYYAFFQLSLQSIVLGIALSVVCYMIIRRYNVVYNPRLGACLFVLTALSFLIFAATGRYPQICFNLGNRVTIFGSLMVVYLLVALPMPKKVRGILCALLILTIFGISDHWKLWNIHQQKVILAMKNNGDLREYREDKALYFSGNQYSKYGPISHIEFLSEGWVPMCIYKLLFGRPVVTYPINKRFRYADGYLTDAKYGTREKVDGYINVYDSEGDKLFKLKAEDINGYIYSLPADDRHWIQMCDVKLVKGLAVKLMPRLNYIR